MSVAAKRRGQDLKFRSKMSAMRKGKKLSVEHRAKIKQSAARGSNHHFFGKHQSVEARRKMSEAAKRRWRNPAYRERAMRTFRRVTHIRPTSPELTMRCILDRHFPGEWKYTGDGDMIIGRYNPDFTNINGQKAVVEVFGDYWHGERRAGVPNDRAVADRIAYFAKYGFACAVIWEREVKDEQLVVSRISALTPAGGAPTARG
jgi:G:T-mismatch repair DNA endonuclease (very short patch repair protein)